MKKITLNFFGEKAEIVLPKTLGDLHNQIADQFLFSPEDTLELIVSYVKDFKRVIIKTVSDYMSMLTSKEVTDINLEISENSRLYQEKKQSIFNEEDKLKEDCDKLKEEIANLNNNKNAEINAIQDKIRALRYQINELVKDSMIKRNQHEALLKTKIAALEEIERKLNKFAEVKQEPIIRKQRVLLRPFIRAKSFKPLPVQKIRKPKKEEPIIQQEVIHPCVMCDGCHLRPLKGIRYKCAVCPNFDYCSACEEKYAEIHQHPFIMIRNPKMKVAPFQYNHKMPEFDKKIHN